MKTKLWVMSWMKMLWQSYQTQMQIEKQEQSNLDLQTLVSIFEKKESRELPIHFSLEFQSVKV